MWTVPRVSTMNCFALSRADSRMDFEQYARAKTFNQVVASTWADTFAELIGRASRSRADLQLLDYGCGDGKYFNHLLRVGLVPKNVHGVDVSTLRVERCRALGWQQVQCIPKSGRLPFPADQFDVVNMMEVIEHVPSAVIDDVLDEISRVLRPDGVLLGSTPNYPMKRFYDVYDAVIFRKLGRFKDDPTHVTHYDHRRLRELLQRHFRTVDLRCFKSGFLYRRFARAPLLMHKMLFVCREPGVTLEALEQKDRS